MVTFGPIQIQKGKPQSSKQLTRGGAKRLQDYHLKRICVALPVGRSRAYLCGQAHHEHDPLLGSVLRLSLEGDAATGRPEVLISESTWRGMIEPDTEHGCDYCFVPAATQDELPPRLCECHP